MDRVLVVCHCRPQTVPRPNLEPTCAASLKAAFQIRLWWLIAGGGVSQPRFTWFLNNVSPGFHLVFKQYFPVLPGFYLVLNNIFPFHLVFKQYFPVSPCFHLVFKQYIPVTPGFHLVFKQYFPVSPGFHLVFKQYFHVSPGLYLVLDNISILLVHHNLTGAALRIAGCLAIPIFWKLN